jgi:hypothetical protein
MKALAVVLFLALAALAWALVVEVSTERRLRTQIQQLTSRLGNESRFDQLKLDERCAAQAKSVFQTMGYKEMQIGVNTDSWQSHYNTKLGKCFMTVESTGVSNETQFVSRILLDAFERRIYGQYTWTSRKDKKYWEVPPMLCVLTQSSMSEQTCKSEGEYKAFVAKYIE